MVLPVGDWAAVLGTPRIEHLPQVSNPVWLATADDGEVYVLKRLPEHSPGVGLVEEFRVLLHLQANGVPVAVPLITDDGHICARREGVSYILIPRLPTDDDDPPGAVVGAAIARLHKALATYAWPIRSFTHDLVPEFHGLDLPAELMDRTVAPHRDWLIAAMSDLPMQRIHGDCNNGNVLVHEGNFSGFIDLDHLPIGPRVYDVAYYLVHLMQDRHRRQDGNSASFLSFAGELLDGYRSEATLSERETVAVAPTMLAAAAGLADWHGRERSYDADKLDENAAAMTWICEHLDELTAAVRPAGG